MNTIIKSTDSTVTLSFCGKRQGSFTISIEDLPFVLNHKWYFKNSRKGSNAYIWSKAGYLHRCLLSYQLDASILENPVCDHINQDTTDNTRQNLRVVDRATNRYNSKKNKDKEDKFRGVFAQTQKNGKTFYQVRAGKTYVGVSENPVQAAKMYDTYIMLNHPDLKSCLNFK